LLSFKSGDITFGRPVGLRIGLRRLAAEVIEIKEPSGGNQNCDGGLWYGPSLYIFSRIRQARTNQADVSAYRQDLERYSDGSRSANLDNTIDATATGHLNPIRRLAIIDGFGGLSAFIRAPSPIWASCRNGPYSPKNPNFNSTAGAHHITLPELSRTETAAWAPSSTGSRAPPNASYSVENSSSSIASALARPQTLF
jgi:hypothetical protein